MNFFKNAYACGICQHSFLDSKSLLSHVQTKHVADKNSRHGHTDQKDNTLTLHRGWVKKKFTNVLLHTAKRIELRVKSQFRGQNIRSRALKWGIVHLCNLNGFGDMIKDKIYNFLKFLHFSQFSIVISTLFYKNPNFEQLKFL